MGQPFYTVARNTTHFKQIIQGGQVDNQRANLSWIEGHIPMSVTFDDPYFSLENGLAETRHVFLDGNDLPARFGGGFHVAELGFGTGLNFLCTVAAWRATGITGVLNFTSFEAFPMTLEDMAMALAAFPELSDLATEMLDALAAGGWSHDLGDVQLEVIVGDARDMLPNWSGRADAWYLDGFSPAKNPELWGAKLMQDVANHTKAGGTVATYTAAGFVRRGLQDAGFEVTRTKGFGRKRHMTQGQLL